MNERNMEHPGFVINPLFAHALATGEVMVLAFPFRAGMRAAADRVEETVPEEPHRDPRRN
jgi:hypothetical protein